MRRQRRQGFSLLEVLLATGILVGSAVALMELASIGSSHAASARDLTKSQLLCQTRLNQIVCGLEPAKEVQPSPIEGEPGWVYWVEVTPSDVPGISIVEVGTARELVANKQTAKCALVRWVRDQVPTDGSTADPMSPELSPGSILPELPTGNLFPQRGAP